VGAAEKDGGNARFVINLHNRLILYLAKNQATRTSDKGRYHSTCTSMGVNLAPVPSRATVLHVLECPSVIYLLGRLVQSFAAVSLGCHPTSRTCIRKTRDELPPSGANEAGNPLLLANNLLAHGPYRLGRIKPCSHLLLQHHQRPQNLPQLHLVHLLVSGMSTRYWLREALFP